MNNETLINILRSNGDIETVSTVAEAENISIENLKKSILSGKTVIPCNINNRGKIKVCGVGEKLSVKVNANIGTSPDYIDLEKEILKTEAAIKYGADAVMDLSTGGDLDDILLKIRRTAAVPLGTVPVYTAIAKAKKKYGDISKIQEEDLFEAVEKHCASGVDFITVHCGVTRRVIDILNREKRVLNIVSRGGSLMAEFMLKNNVENPFYEKYEKLLDIAEKYDVTLSLGDGLRPGCIADATDSPQIEELIVLSELASAALKRGVQVMIEGPGHIPLDEVERNIQMQKSICKGAPFYVLGPLVTDIGAGYDHITGAIGGAIAAMAGADFLCYVTPSEHLGIPDIEDVRQGVIASKIAAHAADIVHNNNNARKRDLEMAVARRELNWKKQIELALDSDKAKEIRYRNLPQDEELCTMCGDFCAVKKSGDIFNK